MILRTRNEDAAGSVAELLQAQTKSDGRQKSQGGEVAFMPYLKRELGSSETAAPDEKLPETAPAADEARPQEQKRAENYQPGENAAVEKLKIGLEKEKFLEKSVAKKKTGENAASALSGNGAEIVAGGLKHQAKTARKKNAEKAGETPGESQEDLRKIEKYLERLTGGQGVFVVTRKDPQVVRAGTFTFREQPGITFDAARKEKLISRLRQTLERDMPGIKLSKLNIEMVSVKIAKPADSKAQVAAPEKNRIQAAAPEKAQVQVPRKNDNASRAKIVQNEQTARETTARTKNAATNVGEAVQTVANAVQAPKKSAGKSTDGAGNGSREAGQGFHGLSARPRPAEVKSEFAAALKTRQAEPLEQVREMVGASKILDGEGGASLKMVLHPEKLGRLTLEVSMTENGIAAKFVTDNPETREALMAGEEQLRQMLAEKGVAVTAIEFFNGDSGAGGEWTGYSGQADQNGGGHGFEGRDRNEGGEGFAKFTESIEVSTAGGDKRFVSEDLVNFRV